jgi:hypothetical protein
VAISVYLGAAQEAFLQSDASFGNWYTFAGYAASPEFSAHGIRKWPDVSSSDSQVSNS